MQLVKQESSSGPVTRRIIHGRLWIIFHIDAIFGATGRLQFTCSELLSTYVGGTFVLVFLDMGV
jgi:hypothetical protein